MKMSKRLLAVAVSAALYAPLANATNGMNMEGYGPIATGMGGASMAYDNGTAAMANNVATLGLAEDGTRIDVALGSLSPSVHADAYGQDSKATQFFMPAMGWTTKSGNISYGLGVFAQGGMGTEYDIMGGMMKDRSEVGVGRLIVPFAYNVNDALTVGASLDYVWATMDLQMTAPFGMLAPMVTYATPIMAGAVGGTPANWYGRFDFSDNNDYSGEAQGNGFAGKLGLTYKLSPSMTLGFNYQSETAMGDLETGNDAATMMVITNTGLNVATMTGKVTIKNFQWPQTFALGLSWKASDNLMVAADIKQIQWSEVMKNFNMSYTVTSGPMMGERLDVSMPQNWDDQTVLQLGVTSKVSDAFTVRGGLNLANNPVPDATVNALFPAIIENHLTLGLGYAVSKAQDVNFSMTYAPEVEVTNPNMPVGQQKITHSQTNWQLMYSHRF